MFDSCVRKWWPTGRWIRTGRLRASKRPIQLLCSVPIAESTACAPAVVLSRYLNARARQVEDDSLAARVIVSMTKATIGAGYPA